jgi:hypothetical protein
LLFSLFSFAEFRNNLLPKQNIKGIIIYCLMGRILCVSPCFFLFLVLFKAALRDREKGQEEDRLPRNMDNSGRDRGWLIHVMISGLEVYLEIK